MRTVLVTGASDGIGLEIARLFALRGDSVYAGIRDERHARTLNALARATPNLHVVRLDVRDDDEVAHVREIVERADRPIDTLVNNAGIHDGGSVESMAEARVEALFATNYLGAVRLIRAFLPAMRRAGRGAIVNISSITARFPAACGAHYAASKAALETFSEALAQEVASFGVRVALIVPGPVRTGILHNTRRAADLPAYAAHQRRLARRREVLGERAAEALTVAHTVLEAVDALGARLRWPVGGDALAVWNARERTRDEDWVRCAALADDDAYYDEAARLFGVDLHRPAKDIAG